MVDLCAFGHTSNGNQQKRWVLNNLVESDATEPRSGELEPGKRLSAREPFILRMEKTANYAKHFSHKATK